MGLDGGIFVLDFGLHGFVVCIALVLVVLDLGLHAFRFCPLSCLGSWPAQCFLPPTFQRPLCLGSWPSRYLLEAPRRGKWVMVRTLASTISRGAANALAALRMGQQRVDFDLGLLSLSYRLPWTTGARRSLKPRGFVVPSPQLLCSSEPLLEARCRQLLAAMRGASCRPPALRRCALQAPYQG